jgi:formate dehydrogenase subunit delta
MVYMVNQIAAFFGTAMVGDAAVGGFADHLNRFWAPSMRRQFFEIVESGRRDLSPLAIAAATKVRKP